MSPCWRDTLAKVKKCESVTCGMFRAGVAERSVTFCGLPLLLEQLDIRIYSGERFLSNTFFLDTPFAIEC